MAKGEITDSQQQLLALALEGDSGEAERHEPRSSSLLQHLGTVM